MRKPSLKILFIFCCVIFIDVIISGAKQIIQPIEYNHKIHIEDAGLTCLDCHINAETQARALIPNFKVCADCHDDPESDNVKLRKVANYVEKQIEIPWIQINMVADYAYFSHRRHVKLGQLKCSACHGEVAKKENPFVQPFVSIKMSWCMDCHEKHEVTNDCYACHR